MIFFISVGLQASPQKMCKCLLAKCSVTGEEINAIEVYTKMTTEWTRMVTESFMVKTKKGNWPPA